MNTPDWAEDIAFQVRAITMPDVVENDELLAGLAHIAKAVMSAVEVRDLRATFSTSLSDR